MKKIATPVGGRLDGFTGDARLYKLEPPIEQKDWDGTLVATHEFVVVSAVSVPFTGPETYIFPADAGGNVVDWGELDGSARGHMDHSLALSDAGYTAL